MRLFDFDAISKMQQFLVEETVNILQQSIRQKGEACFSIGGGRFPPGLLKALAQYSLPWSDIRIIIGDERCVPLSSSFNNEGQLRSILEELDISPKEIIGLFDGTLTADEAKKNKESQFKHLPIPLDISFIGMGEDGHFAGIFEATPEGQIFDLKNAFCLTPANEKTLIGGHWRLSMNLVTLTHASYIFLHAPGYKKAQLIRRLLREDASSFKYPIQFLLAKKLDNLCICLCDKVD